MSIEIYYFSGTGNSLRVAKELEKRLPDTKLFPIVSLLNKEIIEIKGETVGFIFPLYLTTVPGPVKIFLNKIDLENVKYLFTVITREGTLSITEIYMNKILKKYKGKLDSFFILKMAGNSPTGLKPTDGDKDWINKITKEKILELESDVQKNLRLIQETVLNKEKYPVKNRANPITYLLEKIISLDSHVQVVKYARKFVRHRKLKLLIKNLSDRKILNVFTVMLVLIFVPNNQYCMKNTL